MAAFAEFASDLDAATKQQLLRGKIMTEILKQGQYVPMPVEKQVMIIFAGISGMLDDIPVGKVKQFEDEFLRFMGTSHSDVGSDIRETEDLKPETEEKLRKAIEEFKGIFVKD